LPNVLFDRNGPVVTVILNRPERLNAIETGMLDLLLPGLEDLAADEEVRAVVLTGAGRGFCAGGDVGALASLPDPADQAARAPDHGGDRVASMRSVVRITELLRAMPKVTIAAVNGPCAGAGLSWACACDIRYAASSAIFTTAFVAVGQPGDYGITWMLPRIIGGGQARELLLTGERFDAHRAERIGLVSAVLPDDDLLPHATAVAVRAAARSPLAVAALKANLDDADDLTLAALLDRESERFIANQDTFDAGEAARAFVEKRPPRFERR
jgi:2-(1,2-epoxy-1,2-dihydrophenyl)acetyl-CoA isomerase